MTTTISRHDAFPHPLMLEPRSLMKVSTLADGVTPTATEAAAAARIRAAYPNDQLLIVPKK